MYDSFSMSNISAVRFEKNNLVAITLTFICVVAYFVIIFQIEGSDLFPIMFSAAIASVIVIFMTILYAYKLHRAKKNPRVLSLGSKGVMYTDIEGSRKHEWNEIESIDFDMVGENISTTINFSNGKKDYLYVYDPTSIYDFAQLANEYAGRKVMTTSLMAKLHRGKTYLCVCLLSIVSALGFLHFMLFIFPNL